MELFDPTFRLTKTQKIIRFAFLILLFAMLFAGIAGMVINFHPAEDTKLVFMISSALINLLLICFAVSKYPKWPNDAPRIDPFRDKSKSYIVLMSLIIWLVFTLLTFLSLSITASALATDQYGVPYLAEDMVIKTEECNGRGCSFCTKQVWLKNHEQGAFGEFCLSDSEWASLKAGNKVLVIGRSSFLGVSLDSFQLIK
jgi:hypothetical protein